MTKFNTDAFRELENYWYRRLAGEGFEDIEETGVPGFEEGRPLKRWTGISDSPDYLDATEGLSGSTFSREERFYHHASFADVCFSITKHGNHSLTPSQVSAIWAAHIEGDTIRGIGRTFSINPVAVFRVIKKIEAYSELMGEEDLETQPESAARLILRPYLPQDAALVYATWRNALWFDDKRDPARADAFFRKATQAIKKMLGTPDCQIRIACLDDDTTTIIGYSVLHGSELTWIYVKADYREKGIGAFLARGFKTISEPMTKIGKAIARNHNLTSQESPDDRRKA